MPASGAFGVVHRDGRANKEKSGHLSPEIPAETGKARKRLGTQPVAPRGKPTAWVPNSPAGAGLFWLVQRLYGGRQLGQYVKNVAHDAVIGRFEERSLGVFVDDHNHLRAVHAGKVLDSTRNAAGNV